MRSTTDLRGRADHLGGDVLVVRWPWPGVPKFAFRGRTAETATAISEAPLNFVCRRAAISADATSAQQVAGIASGLALLEGEVRSRP